MAIKTKSFVYVLTGKILNHRRKGSFYGHANYTSHNKLTRIKFEKRFVKTFVPD